MLVRTNPGRAGHFKFFIFWLIEKLENIEISQVLDKKSQHFESVNRRCIYIQSVDLTRPIINNQSKQTKMSTAAKNVVLIDNYDSFTWNVYEYLCQEGARVTVYRNDQITLPELIAVSYTHLDVYKRQV